MTLISNQQDVEKLRLEMQEIDQQLRSMSLPGDRGQYFPPGGSRDRGQDGRHDGYHDDLAPRGRVSMRGRGRGGRNRRWGNDRHAANIAGQ